ncbi:MAG: hypothetical protein HY908_26335 [Myxococcales bacterium]|nr:hypothetical protein [Myxococcales bacterium]
MTKTTIALFTAGTLLLAFAGCDKGGGGGTATNEAKTEAKPESKAAGASGESVSAPECDEVLKKAAAPECKDKPGMSAITANRDNWKNGLANATTKDATIQACKAAMEAVKAVGCGGGATGAGAPTSASASASAGAGATDSVGAPECDEILEKAASPACKDKPGMSAITANRDNWKNGLSTAMTRDATIQACKAAMEALKAVGCDGGAAGATGTGGWDGKTPYKCGGNDNALITGVTANIAAGPAIEAAGNCKVTFKGCTITTDKGIAASGNAAVTLDGGELQASDTAIDASGNAQVTANGAKVSGKVHTSGNAKVTGVSATK